MLPVLTIFSDLLAILGGMVVANVSLHVGFNTFASGLKLLFRTQDLVGGLMKTFVFGFIIALMGCYHGFETRGGAEGVGHRDDEGGRLLVPPHSHLELSARVPHLPHSLRALFVGGPAWSSAAATQSSESAA